MEWSIWYHKKSYTETLLLEIACGSNISPSNILLCVYLLIMTRIDTHSLIKITDFGLSEDLFVKNYFRQGDESSVKLPVKWMAPESLGDGLFSEKSDVVRSYKNQVFSEN